MSCVVAQLGARMHYAVPRILHAESLLAHLFTDISANKGWLRWCSRIPSALQADGLRRIVGRAPKAIPSDRITAFNQFGIRYAYRCRNAHSPSEFARIFLWAGRTFCRHILRRGLGDANAIYVFNSAGLELLEDAQAAGRYKIVE